MAATSVEGTLVSLGSARSVSVAFEWGEIEAGPCPNKAIVGELAAPGPFRLDALELGLAPGKTYYFRTLADGAGRSVGDATKVILRPEMIGAPRASVTHLVVHPATVESGDAVAVTVQVVNMGTSGTVALGLMLDGEGVETAMVELAAGESSAVEFTLTIGETGVHQIGLVDQSATIEVVPPTRTTWLWVMPSVVLLVGLAEWFSRRSGRV